MQLSHTFEVPADIATAWSALSDLGRVANCMPGATLTDIDGDHFAGRVRIKVGPMQLTYRGEGLVVDLDQEAYRIAIEASGKEARGQGTARAAVRAQLRAVGADTTDVAISTDLDVTGKPAQFGRGVMNDVGQKLLDRFAQQLAKQLEGLDGAQTGEVPASVTAGTRSPKVATPSPRSPGPSDLPPPPPPPTGNLTRVNAPPVASDGATDDDAIDLMDLAGGAIAKRLAPLFGATLVGLAIWALRRRRDYPTHQGSAGGRLR